ncbi:MAG: type II toxin-antitoxin system VapC family toxin [Verrucomicrobia bacterium]|nr:type II toxin-antitoxin system VapC family toxin [Verrucomicrobiota bacterium]
MQKHQFVAADTNVLLRLAGGHEPTIDAWLLIQRRLHPVQFLAPPTVLHELAGQAAGNSDPAVREVALRALRELRSRWHFKPEEFNAVQEGIADHAVRRLRDSGLLPYAERNDAAIVTESAILNCVLLVSHDSHLLDLDHEKLALLFRRLDLPAPMISSPEKLLKTFYT